MKKIYRTIITLALFNILSHTVSWGMDGQKQQESSEPNSYYKLIQTKSLYQCIDDFHKMKVASGLGECVEFFKEAQNLHREFIKFIESDREIVSKIDLVDGDQRITPLALTVKTYEYELFEALLKRSQNPCASIVMLQQDTKTWEIAMNHTRYATLIKKYSNTLDQSKEK